MISQTTLISPRVAGLIAGVTPMTIVRWSVRFGIGSKKVGRWQIDFSALQALLKAPPEPVERLVDES